MIIKIYNVSSKKKEWEKRTNIYVCDKISIEII
jgi:hypothetical protein